jgi:hypothetical protein
MSSGDRVRVGLTGIETFDALSVSLAFGLGIPTMPVPDGDRVDGRSEADQGPVDGGRRELHVDGVWWMSMSM